MEEITTCVKYVSFMFDKALECYLLGNNQI
jgi:hypothetical protein